MTNTISGKSLKLDDTRKVFLARIPEGEGWYAQFTNKDGEKTDMALSAEALKALIQLAEDYDKPTIVEYVWRRLESTLKVLDEKVKKP